MTQVTKEVTLCDECGGEIPEGADHISNAAGTLILGGQMTPFQNKDFCCSQHMLEYLQAQPVIATPNPLYPPPPKESSQ